MLNSTSMFILQSCVNLCRYFYNISIDFLVIISKYFGASNNLNTNSLFKRNVYV